jgi:hypothetical protein
LACQGTQQRQGNEQQQALNEPLTVLPRLSCCHDSVGYMYFVFLKDMHIEVLKTGAQMVLMNLVGPINLVRADFCFASRVTTAIYPCKCKCSPAATPAAVFEFAVLTLVVSILEPRWSQNLAC